MQVTISSIITIYNHYYNLTTTYYNYNYNNKLLVRFTNYKLDNYNYKFTMSNWNNNYNQNLQITIINLGLHLQIMK